MRLSRATAIPVILGVSLLAGCNNGGSSASSSSSTASSASASQSASGAASASSSASTDATATSADCPTSNTRSFAKTRFVGDVGLAAGTFHRYLWKPYQAGSFKKGANGRVKAIVKGGATAALDLKLLSNAKKNVQANPTLCKTLYKPISEATTALSGAKGDLTAGNFGVLSTLESKFAQIEKGSAAQGDTITESTNENQAS